MNWAAGGCSALYLLLWADVTVVSTLSLAAVSGLWWESSVALSANHLFTLVGSGQGGKRWLNLNASETTTTESEYKMESGFLLNVVVLKSAAILELLSSKNQSLLIWWNSFLVLNLGLDVLNGIRWLNIKGDGLAGEGLDEDLHTTSKSQHQVESGLLLDVVVGEGSTVLELLTSEDEALLVWWDAFLVLDLGLDVLN